MLMDRLLICWDSRNLNTPSQVLQFDLSISDDEDIKRFGLTCLEYDSSSPHRFTLGTEQGVIMSCNRKFKEVREMVTSCYSTHSIPILNITRNAFFPKLFASCCAWDVKIWSEDLTVSPIITLRSQDGYITDASWTPAHPSFLFVTKTTGHLELWDILIKHHEPIVSFKLESDGLTCVYTKQQGELLVCGTDAGCIHLLNIPEYYTSTTKQEKNLVAAMIDREGKREKILEGKSREKKLREKLESRNRDILNSPRNEIINNPITEVINSPRSEILHSPKSDVVHSPRHEIVSENNFNFEEKLDIVENGADEFNSIFDGSQKTDDNDIVEPSNEKVQFDMQSCDVLYSLLDAVKQQNQLNNHK